PTSMPIERAEPSTMRIAASIVSQFKSFIFCSAISRSCALVTEPTLSRRGAHLEREGAVLVDRDHDRNRGTLLHLLGLRVELLAELHDREAALTKRGSDRRRG